MSNNFTSVLERAENTLLFVDNLVNKKVKLLDEIMQGMTTYLEASETSITLLEMAGAEIEGKGKADPKMILGRNNSWFAKNRKKGLSLSDYYGVKARSLALIANSLTNLLTLNNKELSSNNFFGQELITEIKSVHKEEHQPDKRTLKKIKKIEKILSKAEADLRNESNLTDEEIKLFNKELEGYIVIRKLVFAVSNRLKKLTGFFAKYAYKKIAKYTNKERRLVIKQFRQTRKFLRETNEEIQKLSFIAGDVNKCFKIAEHHSDSNLISAVKNLKQETKHIKSMGRLSRIEKRLERRLDKLHSIDDFNENKKALELDEDLRNEEKDLKELTKEEQDLEQIESAMDKLEKYIGKLLNFSGNLVNQLSYFLRYSNQAYISAGKFKKNPAAIIPYLNKLKEFIQKSLEKILQRMETEENQLKKEIGEETKLFEDFASILNKLSKTTDKKLIGSISKSIKHLNKIEKDLHKQFNDSLKKFKKEEKQEGRIRFFDKKIGRFAKRLNISVGGRLTRDSVKEKKNIQADEQEIRQNQEKLSSEVEKVRKEFQIVEERLPRFDVLSKGGIPRLIHKKLKTVFSEDKQLPRDISIVMEKYSLWLNNFFNAEIYIDFIDSLANKLKLDEEFLRDFHNVCSLLGKNEKELVELFQQLNQSMEDVLKADKALSEFERTFSNYLEASRDIFEQTKGEFNLVREEVQNISKLEKSFQVGINAISLVENAIESAENNNKQFNEILKTAKNKIKPNKILTQDIIKN